MGDYIGFYSKNLKLKKVLLSEDFNLLKMLVSNTLHELLIDNNSPSVNDNNLALFEKWGSPHNRYWNTKYSFHKEAYLEHLTPFLEFDRSVKSYRLTFCLISKSHSGIFSFLNWLKPLIEETNSYIGYLDFSDVSSLDDYSEEQLKEYIFLKDM